MKRYGSIEGMIEDENGNMVLSRLEERRCR